MSDEDRLRWNRRYGDGAYVGRDHPAEWLVHCLERLATEAATARLIAFTGCSGIWIRGCPQTCLMPI